MGGGADWSEDVDAGDEVALGVEEGDEADEDLHGAAGPRGQGFQQVPPEGRFEVRGQRSQATFTVGGSTPPPRGVLAILPS